jgi:hypothetical protein
MYEAHIRSLLAIKFPSCVQLVTYNVCLSFAIFSNEGEMCKFDRDQVELLHKPHEDEFRLPWYEQFYCGRNNSRDCAAVYFACGDQDKLDLLEDSGKGLSIFVQSDLFCELTNGRGELERSYPPTILQQLRHYQLARTAAISGASGTAAAAWYPNEQSLELGSSAVTQYANDLTLTYGELTEQGALELLHQWRELSLSGRLLREGGARFHDLVGTMDLSLVFARVFFLLLTHVTHRALGLVVWSFLWPWWAR